MPIYLSPEQLERALTLPDLTDPRDGPHAIQGLVDVAALTSRWGCPQRRSWGPRLVAIADNYDNLGFDADAASRDARYTRYVDGRRMLRSHASAMIPPALRALAADPIDDALIVCPGIVFRRDSIDRLHTATPHQLDLWRICRRNLDNADLDERPGCCSTRSRPGWRLGPKRGCTPTRSTATRSTSTPAMTGSKCGSAGLPIPRFSPAPASQAGTVSRSDWASTVS